MLRVVPTRRIPLECGYIRASVVLLRLSIISITTGSDTRTSSLLTFYSPGSAYASQTSALQLTSQHCSRARPTTGSEERLNILLLRLQTIKRVVVLQTYFHL